MKSTSSRRSAVALLLCDAAVASAPTVAAADAGTPMEPALLLKYAAPDLPDRSARGVLDPIPAIVAKELRIRWLLSPWNLQGRTRPPGRSGSRDAALRRIAGMVSPSLGTDEKVESASASLLLEEAEKECRSYRFTEATRVPRGDLSPAGDPSVSGRGRWSDAEALFSRVRALRPDHPGPRPVSSAGVVRMGKRSDRPLPRRNSWSSRSPPARRSSSTERQGVTPARVRTKGNRADTDPRLSSRIQGCRKHPDRWLPGTPRSCVFLPGDRVACLGELLAGGAQGKVVARGPLVGELSRRRDLAGVAILMLEKGAGERGCALGSTPEGRPSQDPALLGKRRSPREREARDLRQMGPPTPLPRTDGPRADRPEGSCTAAPGSGESSCPWGWRRGRAGSGAAGRQCGGSSGAP